ncbi:hypothetical protein GWI33_022073 [Rhynchophorus ferrugineus]|uniref:Uncharacterized protein n=1 Tax=Rhynchophorus ferrugineus TaxID=354439 RepID=A0A834IQP4_RHYFE|nr:hypothetical protein GWI33_022073 [Rhynchophorus ferrugineus]
MFDFGSPGCNRMDTCFKRLRCREGVEQSLPRQIEVNLQGIPLDTGTTKEGSRLRPNLLISPEHASS